jgi:predicted RNA binding protein YcfA (HicA-like mRNA interferase family)
MPKIPQISGKSLVKVLEKIGYFVVRQRGSHIRMHHEDRWPITIPNHKILGKGLLRKILRDAELSTNDFLKLLKK